MAKKKKSARRPARGKKRAAKKKTAKKKAAKRKPARKPAKRAAKKRTAPKKRAPRRQPAPSNESSGMGMGRTLGTAAAAGLAGAALGSRFGQPVRGEEE